MTEKKLVVDTHTHIFCWGENPKEGFLSERTRRSLVTRMIMRLMRIHSEPGNTLSQKLRNRLLRHVESSSLDYVVVLAQDAVYRADGSCNEMATPLYVSNDYVLELAKESRAILPGCSINPVRTDAIEELERCYAAGCRLIKIHTSIQGVDPALPQFDPCYRRARDLGGVLMFHMGYEHSCKVVSQKYSDPRRLERVLDHGGVVISAHCGTCAFYDPEDYYPHFIEMMRRHDNLYGDTAVMASLIRWNALRRLSHEDQTLKNRILHGSDYPIPPSRLPYLFRTGLFPPERKNALDMDLLVKRSFQFSPGYEHRILELMGVSP